MAGTETRGALAVTVRSQPVPSPHPIINKSPFVGSRRSGFHCTVCTGDTGHVENFESTAVNGVVAGGAGRGELREPGEGRRGGGEGRELSELLFSFR